MRYMFPKVKLGVLYDKNSRLGVKLQIHAVNQKTVKNKGGLVISHATVNSAPPWKTRPVLKAEF